MKPSRPSSAADERASTIRLVRRIWEYVPARARLVIVGDAVLNVVLGFTASAPALVVGALVDGLASPGSGAGLVLLIGLLAALYLTQAVLRTVVNVSMHGVMPTMEVEFRHAQVAHALRTPMMDAEQRFAVEINSQLSRGAEGASRLVRLVFGDMFPAILQAAWAVGLAFYKSPLIGLMIAASAPIGFVLVHYQLKSQSGVRMKIERDKGRLDGVLTELLQGKAIVRSLDAVESESQRVRTYAQTVSDAERRHHQAMGWFEAGKFSTESIFAVGVAVIGVLLVTRGAMAPGSVLALFLLFQQAAAPLHDIHRMRDEANESVIQAKRAFQLLDEPEDRLFSLPRWTGPVGSAAAVRATGMRASYGTQDPSSVEVLREVCFDVDDGQFVGVVGPTGSGKSTLVKCIVGLHSLDGGIVELFGRRLDDIGAADLADDVAYASQQPYLLAGTVRQNVTFGIKRPCSDDEIVAALRAAAIWDDHSSVFPDGLDTMLGEGGSGLSGGEKQRVVLARLILRKPRMLILDEATSALDNITEQAVMSSVRRLGTTVIAIAHRLSTLRGADNIVVLDAGRVVEQGTYHALEASGGLFCRLLNANASSGSTHRATGIETHPLKASARMCESAEVPLVVSSQNAACA